MSNPRNPSSVYQIGGATVCPLSGEITTADGRQKVSPRSLQVLNLLVDAGTDCVLRTDIIAAVWDDNYLVGDKGLRHTIWELRRALDDDPKIPRYIQTVPRKGYRLIKPAEPVARPRARRRLRPVAAACALGCTLGAALWVAPGENSLIEPGPSRYLPAVSPDQTHRAQVRIADGQPDLFVWRSTLPVTSIAPLRLADGLKVTDSHGLEQSLAWSPSGSQLAFMQTQDSDGSCRVRLFDLASQRLSTLAEDCVVRPSPLPARLNQVAWTPRGEALAYPAPTSDGGTRIAQVALDGSRSRSLTRPGKHHDAMPRYAADGKLAFLRSSDGSLAAGRVHILEPEGQLKLTCPATQTWGLTWLDSDHLLTASALNNPFRLWVLDSDTGIKTQLARQGRRLEPQPIDGSVLINRYSYSGRLRISPLSEATPPRIPDLPGAAEAITRAGERLVAAVSNGGRRELWVIDGGGTPSRVFTAQEIYRPSLSPDGSQVGFTSRENQNQNARAYILDLATGRSTPASHPRQAAFFGAWMRDGAGYYLLYGVPQPLGTGATLVAHQPGQEPRAIARGAGITVHETESGHLWWSDQSGHVVRMALSGSQPERVVALKSAYESWTVDETGARVLYSRSGADRVEVLEQDAQGHARAVLTLAQPLDPILGISLSADNSLAYRSGTEVWLHREAVAVDRLQEEAMASNFRIPYCYHPADRPLRSSSAAR